MTGSLGYPTVQQSVSTDSSWLRSKQKHKIKIRQKTFGQKEFDLGSINAGYDLAIVKLYQLQCQASTVTRREEKKKRGKMV